MFQPPSQPQTQVGLDGAMSAAKAAPRMVRPPLDGIDPTLRAGDKLYAARQILGLSLDAVAERTRLKREHLEALEAMNVKLLPGKAYTLAYLQGYARFLGLDAEAIVDQFKAESALTREDARPQLRDPSSKPRKERPWLAALAIAAVAASFVGWRAMSQNEAEQRLVEAAADAPLAAPTPAVEIAAAPIGTSAPVELRALKTAWLEVRGPDGTIFFSATVQPGQAYRPDAGSGWSVHAVDGGAFEVVVNGQVLGLLGEEGKPVLGRRVDSLAPAAAALSPSAG